MASITFVSLYDEHSVGIRIMSARLRAAGHDTRVIFLKIPFSRPILYAEENYLEFLFYHDGNLMTWCPKGAPWSETEADLLIDRMDQQTPDIIAVSYRSIFENAILPLLNRMKKKFPESILVAGGFGPMLNPELALTEVDFVAFGDGEDTILDIADAWDNKTPVHDIKNLVYKKNHSTVHNPVRPPIENLDEYHFPDYDNPNTCYIQDDSVHESDPATIYKRIKHHPVIAGRGCVGKCSYCSAGQWRKLYREQGHRIAPRRLRSVDSIIEELRLIKSRGFKRIQFLDEYLVGPMSFMMDLFTRYRDEISLPFMTDLHPFQVLRSPKLLDTICEAGLQTATVAIQHGSETFRHEYLNRHHISNKQMLQLAQLYHERQIQAHYHIIAGFPFETRESLDQSLNFLTLLPWKYAHLTVGRLMNFPCSPLSRLIEEKKYPKIFDYHKWFLTSQLYYSRVIFSDYRFEKIREKHMDLLFDTERSAIIRSANLDLMDQIKTKRRLSLFTNFLSYFRSVKKEKLYKNIPYLLYRLKLLTN